MPTLTIVKTAKLFKVSQLLSYLGLTRYPFCLEPAGCVGAKKKKKKSEWCGNQLLKVDPVLRKDIQPWQRFKARKQSLR